MPDTRELTTTQNHIASRTELLTRRFYAWEERTRGYLTWPYPVSPEPPFTPFYGHYLPQNLTADDSRKPTVLSALAEKVRNFFTGSPEVSAEEADCLNEDDQPPDLYIPEGDLHELQITLPKDFNPAKQLTAQFLSSLSYIRFPVSFEIIGTASQVVIQLAVREADKSQVLNQLKAFLPEAVILEASAYLTSLWPEEDERYRMTVDFGLEKEVMLPLVTQSRSDVDPMTGIVGALAAAENDSTAVLQVIFLPTRFSWPESLINAVTAPDGRPFFADAPELTKKVYAKIEKPLYGVVIRAGAVSSDQTL